MADDIERKPAPFWWPDIRSFVAVTITMTCVGLVFIRQFNPSIVEDKTLDMMVNTFFVLGLAGLMNFLFGSSRGSEDKSEQIKQTMTKLTDTIPPAEPLPDSNNPKNP